jgi:hypothetical protein
VEFFYQLADIDKVQLFSLQKERDPACMRYGEGRGDIIDLSPYIQGFAATASVVDRMDIVITVDTAMAHLAGALGKPVWVLLAYSPDWRWMIAGESTAWYPSMLLFRQDSVRDWPGVFARVVDALDEIQAGG